MVTSADNPWAIQLRTNDIMWYKENLDNIAFKKLYKLIGPTGSVAWIDGDIAFSNPKWVDETLRLLKEFKFVQLFSRCHSLGPNSEILTDDPSFAYQWCNKLDTPQKRGRSGGAWAATLETLHATDYLVDWDIVGASDWYHVFSLTNQTPYTTTTCRAKNERHAEIAKKYVNGSVWYVDAILIHFFHGWPADRGYGTRGQILIRNKFDPDVDVGYREDGLLYFTTDKPVMHQDVVNYFRSRKDHGVEKVLS